MNGLNTSRVLIVDDDVLNDKTHDSEALALILAFAKVGIGAVFHSGDVDNLPPSPNLRGIRLAAVDLDLNNAYPGEARAVVSQTLNVMRSLIAEDNGPYLAIAWTKHESLVEAFQDSVSDLPCGPVRVRFIEKAAVRDGDGKFNTERILEELATALEEAYPLAFFNTWEQLVHDAASVTVRSATSREDWPGEMRKIMLALLGANKPAGDGDANLRALYEALNPIHFDCLESLTRSVDAENLHLVKPLLDAAQNEKPDSNTAADLNRKLVLAAPEPEPAPGCIYLFEEVAAAGAPIPFGEDDLAADMLKAVPGEPCKAVLMEITPMCDYQQNKMKQGRLIAGFAVPFGVKNVLTTADFVNRFEVIRFEGESLHGDHVIAWTAHYLVTVSLADLSKCRSVGRLRHAPLVDVQSWAARQASRPGYLSIRPGKA